MGVHSTFFGPIKYAILPQHLERDEVLGGTGLVEAGTYIAILGGTLLAGVISVQAAAAAVILIALIGYWSGRQVPPAPPIDNGHPIDLNIVRSSIRLVAATLHIPRLFLAIVAISFFWTIGAVLFIQFPPLVKNVLTADKSVASLFLAIFSVGIAIGSVAVNRLLKGEVSARYATPSVLVDGPVRRSLFHVIATGWTACRRRAPSTRSATSSSHPGIWPLLGSLLGIAVAGGMFVVPLYAFLTTTVPKIAGGADGGGQQHRQFGRDGGRLADRDRPHPWPGWRSRTSSCSPRRCASSRPGSPGSCTRPATTSSAPTPRYCRRRSDRRVIARSGRDTAFCGRRHVQLDRVATLAMTMSGPADQGAEEDQAADPAGREQLEILEPGRRRRRRRTGRGASSGSAAAQGPARRAMSGDRRFMAAIKNCLPCPRKGPRRVNLRRPVPPRDGAKPWPPSQKLHIGHGKRHTCWTFPRPTRRIEIVIASQGMSKGLRQTDGMQFVVRPEFAFGPVSSPACSTRT